VGDIVGIEVGLPVGISDGDVVGLVVGVDVGLAVGVAVGSEDGVAVGLEVGVDVGPKVGVTVGLAIGVTVGAPVGIVVGAEVGLVVGGDVGVRVGVVVGLTLGLGVMQTSSPVSKAQVTGHLSLPHLEQRISLFPTQAQVRDLPRIRKSSRSYNFDRKGVCLHFCLVEFVTHLAQHCWRCFLCWRGGGARLRSAQATCDWAELATIVLASSFTTAHPVTVSRFSMQNKGFDIGATSFFRGGERGVATAAACNWAERFPIFSAAGFSCADPCTASLLLINHK